MSNLQSLFEEARRRFESFQSPRGIQLSEAWVGLGYPSTYKSAVSAGFMVPLHGVARKRVLSWYLLTPEGVEYYRQLFPESEGGGHKYKNGVEIAVNQEGANQ